MTGKTVTRADLCEVVYRKVALSRPELAALVELVLKRDRGLPRTWRNRQVFLVRLVRGAQEGPAHRPQSQDPDGSANLVAARDGVQAVGDLLRQRVNSGSRRQRVIWV